NGNTALTNRSTFLVDITGTTPGNVLGDYSQLVVNGALDLGGATLSGIIGNGFIPAAVGAAPTFTIVHSTGALTGQFAQGSTVFLSGMKSAITYDRLANNVDLTRVKANTTTVITGESPASPSTFGTAVTFTATVTPETGATFGLPPTGTVTFSDGALTLATGPLGGNGSGVATATFTTAVDQLTGGNHTITATYNAAADPNFAGGPSAPVSYLVNAAATTTTITGATPVGPSTFGSQVAFTATVTPTIGNTE